MRNIVTNAYLFNDRVGIQRLFAEVIEDPRWEKGHHIITSEVVSVDIESGIVITESGSEYEVKKFFNKEDFIAHIKETFGEERVNYYLFYTNIV